MKRLIRFALVCMLAVSLVLPAAAKVFTDVDSYNSFGDGGNPVFNDGDSVSDYWIGDWNGGGQLDGSKIEIAKDKGWNKTSAIALWEEDAIENQGMYLFISSSNGIEKNYTGTKYLRVWLDLSNVAFRKANFGVTDSKYNLFTTDEENSVAADWPFYYLPENGTEWQTHYHGGDGCFGDAQDSDINGLKGFFAFPVSDFVIRDNDVANHDGLALDTPANMADISGVYLFWDYSDEYTELQGNKFYLDNIEFVSDYKAFDDALYNPPVEVKAEEPQAAAEVAPVAAQTVEIMAVAPSAPATGYSPIMFICLAATAISVFTAIKFDTKIKRNRNI